MPSAFKRLVFFFLILLRNNWVWHYWQLLWHPLFKRVGTILSPVIATIQMSTVRFWLFDIQNVPSLMNCDNVRALIGKLPPLSQTEWHPSCCWNSPPQPCHLRGEQSHGEDRYVVLETGRSPSRVKAFRNQRTAGFVFRCCVQCCVPFGLVNSLQLLIHGSVFPIKLLN